MSSVLLFIGLDIFKLPSLWKESLFRVVFRHFQSSNYDPKKKPLVHFISQLFDNKDIEVIKSISLKDTKKTNNTNIVFKYFDVGHQYSTKIQYYFNDFDEKTQKVLETIGLNLIPKLNEITNLKLELENSNFRACLLRYVGEKSNFGWHYDAEHPDCLKVIGLYHKKGNIARLCYLDEKGEKTYVPLDIGDAIIFRGTTTYHSVEPSTDVNMERFVVGFQYKILRKNKSKEFKSLANQLRGKYAIDYFKLLLPYTLLISIIVYYNQDHLYNSNLIIISLVTLLISLTSYFKKISPTSIKSLLFTYLFYLGFSFNFVFSLHFLAYISLTEIIFNKNNLNDDDN